MSKSIGLRIQFLTSSHYLLDVGVFRDILWHYCNLKRSNLTLKFIIYLFSDLEMPTLGGDQVSREKNEHYLYGITNNFIHLQS